MCVFKQYTALDNIFEGAQFVKQFSNVHFAAKRKKALSYNSELFTGK